MLHPIFCTYISSTEDYKTIHIYTVQYFFHHRKNVVLLHDYKMHTFIPTPTHQDGIVYNDYSSHLAS